MRVGLLVWIALLPGCDEVLGLNRTPIDAAIDAPDLPACFADPLYRPVGTIPESRYAAGTQPTTWLAAREECRIAGAHLVVTSQLDAEWDALIGGDRLANSHWVGLSNFAHNVDFISLTGERVGVRQPPWATDQPDLVPDEDCVALAANRLSNVTCDGPYVAACECELPVTCQASTSPTREYTVLPAAVTWDQAHAACAAIGYRLAVMTDAEEFETILGVQAGGNLWIDATDRDDEGHWHTRDGCRPYLRWGFGALSRPEPNGSTNENCAAIIDAGSMELIDANCDSAMYSTLCETL